MEFQGLWHKFLEWTLVLTSNHTIDQIYCYLRLRLVECKIFSKCKIFSSENIFGKGKYFQVFGCIPTNALENTF